MVTRHDLNTAIRRSIRMLVLECLNETVLLIQAAVLSCMMLMTVAYGLSTAVLPPWVTYTWMLTMVLLGWSISSPPLSAHFEALDTPRLILGDGVAYAV